MRHIHLHVLVLLAISDAVNKITNTGPEIQEPGLAEPVVKAQKKKTVTKPKPDDGQMDLF